MYGGATCAWLSGGCEHLKVHKNENFLAPILEFVFFRS
jgi:hypothetical protein